MLNKISFKFSFKNVLTIIIGVVAYAYLIDILSHKVNLNDFLLVLKSTNGFFVLIILLISFLMIISQGLFLQSIFRIANVKLNLVDAIVTWLITIPTGLITFGLSGAAIIFYKAKKAGCANSVSTILIGAYYLLYIFANIVFMLALGTSFLVNNIQTNPMHFLIVILLIILFMTFLLSQKVRQTILVFVMKKWPKIFSRYDQDIILNLKQTKILFSFVLAFSTALINFLLFIFIGRIIQYDIAFSVSSKSFIVSEFVAMFSPSGSGVGFVELATTAYLQLLGVKAGGAGLIVLIYRVFNFWLPVILGSILLPIKGFNYIKSPK